MKQDPSLRLPGKTMEDDFEEFNRTFKTHGQARLIDHNRKIVELDSMGFDMRDRIDLLKLTKTSEKKLGNTRICELFQPHFFTTNFWFLWSTTFAFQTWHSAAELRRYMLRFMHEFIRIEDLSGVARTYYNQYDSIILPFETELKKLGVVFKYGHTCVDIGLKVNEKILDKGAIIKTVTSLTLNVDEKL